MHLSFLNIGAAKSGTTSLHDILIQHPDLCIPMEKDFHYFDDDENYAKGKSWYEKKFEKCRTGQLNGEISATYLYSDKAAERIARDYGTDVKILLILRNPARRAYSEYLHQMRSESDHILDFNKYFLERGQIDQQMPLYSSIIDRGFYFKHLQKFDAIFQSSNIKVIVFEEFINNKQEVISDLLDFLGSNQSAEIDVDIQSNAQFRPKNKRFHKMFFTMNRHPVKRLMKFLVPSYIVRAKIRNYFRKINTKRSKEEVLDEGLYSYLMESVYSSDISGLEAFIGRSIDIWK